MPSLDAQHFAAQLASDLATILDGEIGETLPITWPLHCEQLADSASTPILERNQRKSTCAEVTGVLDRISRIDPHIKAWTFVDGDSALAQAHELDRLDGAECKILHGIPMGIKDIIDVAKMPTTAASRHQTGFVPSRDSTLARKLREAGAIIVGKTNTHEYALGGTTPPTRNPWSDDHIPGGSSGGSAAAVASGQIELAIGTDSVGSIRIPASICGVAGIRPTMGRVSRDGVRPLTWAMDTVGPIARSVDLLMRTLTAISGLDPLDPYTSPHVVPNFFAHIGRDLTGVRIGVPRSMFHPCQPEIAAAVEVALEIFASQGAQVRPIEVPFVDVTTSVGMAIFLAEANDYHRVRVQNHPELFDPDTLGFLELGSAIDAQLYVRAIRLQTLIRAGINELFHNVDAIVVPTLPCSPARIGTLTNERVPVGDTTLTLAEAHLRNNLPFALAGVPASSQLCGFDRDGLPIGMSVIAAPFNEARIFHLMSVYESSTDWHLRKPPER